MPILRTGTSWCILVRFWYVVIRCGTSWYSFVRTGTYWYVLVLLGTAWYGLARLGRFSYSYSYILVRTFTSRCVLVRLGTHWYILIRLFTYWYILVRFVSQWYVLSRTLTFCYGLVSGLVRTGTYWNFSLKQLQRVSKESCSQASSSEPAEPRYILQHLRSVTHQAISLIICQRGLMPFHMPSL